MLRLLAVACALLTLTVPGVAADPGPSPDDARVACLSLTGVIDSVQCYVNLVVDNAEKAAQDAIREVCIILFGEPC